MLILRSPVIYKQLYSAARREGYNVLALAQHLDDMAESMLMSQFHNGILRTMKACYEIKAKDLRLIRPFTYVREFQTNDFSRTAKYVHTPLP